MGRIEIKRFTKTNVLLDIEQDIRGSGKENDPIRPIRQFRTKDGRLVAEFDPCGAFYNEKTGNWNVPASSLVKYGGHDIKKLRERFDLEPPQGDLVLYIAKGLNILAPLKPGESYICQECGDNPKNETA